MKTTNKILILLASILVMLIILTCLSYLIMDDADKHKFPFEVGKFLMQLIVIVILGGAIQFIYVILKRNKEEKASESYYSRQLEEGNKLLKSGKILDEEKAIVLLTDLLYRFKHRKQDITNTICSYLRKTYSQEKPFDKKRASLLEFCIKSLAQIPRQDDNNHTLCIDIHQVLIEDINLFGINFNDFVMWGCQFKKVNMSRGSFENADLSGVIFNDCGMEFCNFRKALIAPSPMDNGRTTTFLKTLLWDNNLNESKMVLCTLNNYDKFDDTPIRPFIESNKIILTGN